jgi:hypothetical protein
MNDTSDQDAATQEAPFVRVARDAGHRAETEPRRLHIGAREVVVTEIIDRWLDPRHRYFELRGDDAAIYLIRQDTLRDRWELTLFDSGRRDAARLSST